MILLSSFCRYFEDKRVVIFPEFITCLDQGFALTWLNDLPNQILWVSSERDHYMLSNLSVIPLLTAGR